MIRKVHVVFKTHLDIGFTDFAERVTERYMKLYIPSAIDLAQRMREQGGDRFTWTTGSWLIHEYLESASPEERARLENAIAEGNIAWHALPFTTHSELADAELFRSGLSLSQELDRRFGRHTIAAKMTDVPGHTRGIVPLLAEAGVELLHIGVNGASAVPEVPPIFRWRATGGQEVTVIYRGDYGGKFTMEGLDEALVIEHSDDNLGPQTLEQVQATYGRLREEFSGAEVCASTLDAYAQVLQPHLPTLPVITQEIGDTWIHGAASDPLKIMRLRELLRLRSEWMEQGKLKEGSKEAKRFQLPLLLVCEHTWGMDIKTHLQDTENYSAADFQNARSQPNFKKVESSWEEQRRYIDRAIKALPPALAEEARERLEALTPLPPDEKGLSKKKSPAYRLKSKGFEAEFDPKTGALISFERGADASRAGCRLGELAYAIFDTADYERVWAQYIRHSPMMDIWARQDFTKPGLEKLNLKHNKWMPKVRDFYASHDRALVFATFEERAHAEYGAPELASLQWQLEPDRITLALQLFGKPACRMPEAMLVSMLPGLTGKVRCRMDKLGEPVDPMEVVSRGNRGLHAIGAGVEYADEAGKVLIRSLDAPLMMPGEPQLLDFNDRLPDLRKGPHFLLFNNLWGTNFPMWVEGDLLFRFEVLLD